MNLPNKQDNKCDQKPRIVNDFAFGKAGNNAIEILCAADIFKDGRIEWTDNIEKWYIELQHKIYLADEKSKEMLRRK